MPRAATALALHASILILTASLFALVRPASAEAASPPFQQACSTRAQLIDIIWRGRRTRSKPLHAERYEWGTPAPRSRCDGERRRRPAVGEFLDGSHRGAIVPVLVIRRRVRRRRRRRRRHRPSTRGRRAVLDEYGEDGGGDPIMAAAQANGWARRDGGTYSQITNWYLNCAYPANPLARAPTSRRSPRRDQGHLRGGARACSRGRSPRGGASLGTDCFTPGRNGQIALRALASAAGSRAVACRRRRAGLVLLIATTRSRRCAKLGEHVHADSFIRATGCCTSSLIRLATTPRRWRRRAAHANRSPRSPSSIRRRRPPPLLPPLRHRLQDAPSGQTPTWLCASSNSPSSAGAARPSAAVAVLARPSSSSDLSPSSLAPARVMPGRRPRQTRRRRRRSRRRRRRRRRRSGGASGRRRRRGAEHDGGRAPAEAARARGAAPRRPAGASPQGGALREMVRAAVGLLGDSVEAVSTSAAQCLARLARGERRRVLRVTCARDRRRCGRLTRRLSRAAPTRTRRRTRRSALEYGFVRASLMTKLTSANKADWQSRAKAIAALQMNSGLRAQPTRPPRQAAAARPPARPPARPRARVPSPPRRAAGRAPPRALCSFLCTLLDDTNFEISLTSAPGTPPPQITEHPCSPDAPRPPCAAPRRNSAQMISDVLDRADSMATTLDGASAAAIVGRLMEKFADNKIVIRQQNLKVMKVTDQGPPSSCRRCSRTPRTQLVLIREHGGEHRDHEKSSAATPIAARPRRGDERDVERRRWTTSSRRCRRWHWRRVRSPRRRRAPPSTRCSARKRRRDEKVASDRRRRRRRAQGREAAFRRSQPNDQRVVEFGRPARPRAP